jgi:hypothetical protein
METDELIKTAMQRVADSVRPAGFDAVVIEAGRQRRTRFAIAASIGVAAAAAVGIATAGGIHAFSQGDRAVSPSNPEPSVTYAEWAGGQPSVGAEIRAKAQRVWESFAGTARQQDALSVLSAYWGNKAMDECLARNGYPEWDWSLSRTYADPEDPLQTNTWLAMPMSRWRSNDLVAAKPFLLAEAVMNADPPSAEADAVAACAGSSSGNASRLGTDAPIGRLKNTWRSLVADVGATALPDERAYEDCVTAADVALLRGEESDQPLATRIAYAMSGASPDDADIPSDPINPQQWANPAWQHFLGLEDEFFRADWACRKYIYAEHIGDLDPVIDSFAAQHASEIAEASAYWRQVEADAAALGYTGQRGSLDGVVGSAGR